MTVDKARYTAIGGREVNEDSLSVQERDGCLLAIVADGLGGYACGEVASELTVDTLNALLCGRSLSEDALEEAIYAANSEIFLRQSTQGRMMSTVTALWLDESRALAAHVGDSRIYQIREGRIIYQSEDHSVAQLAVAAGEISAEELRSYPGLNRLVRALGAESEVRMDIDLLEPRRGDSFLLCSDGLWGPVTEKRMLECLSAAKDAETWLAAMRDIAEASGEKRDNNTAVALRLL